MKFLKLFISPFNKLIVKSFSFILFALLMAGCGQDADLQVSIKKSLKDPDSAKFGKVLYFEDSACYEVNAKNSMGGYTGTKISILKKIENKWHVVTFQETTLEGCVDVLKKIKEDKVRSMRLNEDIPLRCVGNPDMKACLDFEKKYPSKK
jgi:hypothetical protein